MAKIQFNSKSFAKFRAVMGKFHDAEHTTKDTLGKLQADIKESKESLENNEKTLEKLNAGDKSVHESKESLEQAIAQFKKQLENYETDRKNCMKKQKIAEIDAESLVTDKLYNGYKEYIEEKGDGDADKFAQVIADWFMEVQTGEDADKVKVYPSGCMGFIGLVGSMNDNRTQKTGMLIKAKTKSAFTKLWLKTLADNLQNAKIIEPHKYTYVPVRMRNKEEKNK